MKSHIRRIQFGVFILLHSGICQGLDLKGVVGKDVILPCVTRELDDNMEVIWKDGRDKNVIIIRNNKQTVYNPKFEGRVITFPGQYKNGNFSIKISKLRLDDADYYECIIPNQHFTVSFNLNVTAAEKETHQTVDGKSDADAVQAKRLGVVVVLLISLLS